jgi:histidine triad (HIT) family protein
LFDLIIRGDVPAHFVAEGDSWYAFLDIYPRSAGHTLVVPKQSVRRIAELDIEVRNALFTGVSDVQNRLSQAFGTEDFTVCIHDGALAGQEVPHVHVHVIPRTTGDGGGTLMSMWPQATAPGGEVDHQSLADLAKRLAEVEA